MAVYSVYMLDNHAEIAADKAEFVPDKFSWSAFLLGPLWLLWNRLWLALVFYVLLMLIGTYVEKYLGMPTSATAWIAMLINLYLGFEGTDLIGAKLLRQNFRLVDITVGSRTDEIEHRFFSRWVANRLASTGDPSGPDNAPSRSGG